jgi:dihydrofolate reductase
MPVSLIVAMDRQNLIGTATGLPWRLPRDLKRFRALTWGKPIILGRKTLDLIGGPLPGRHNIVLTHDLAYRAPGCYVTHTLAEALAVAEHFLAADGGDEIMIAGGSEVYRQALPLCQRIYLTVVDGTFTGTTYFPADRPDPPEWQVVHHEAFPADEKNREAHEFSILERRHPG